MTSFDNYAQQTLAWTARTSRHTYGTVTKACGSEARTDNGRMEKTALLGALCTSSGSARVAARYSSAYAFYGFESVLKAWVRSAWTRKTGKPALNTDLWSALHPLILTTGAPFVWRRVYSSDASNERADSLAAAGAWPRCARR